MVKKYIVSILFIISVLIPLFSPYETVRAETMHSKVGITFSNSYIPSITMDPAAIPDGSTPTDYSSDDQFNKGVLPKTGGNLSSSFIYMGLGSMLVALAILIALAKNNRENRNKCFYQINKKHINGGTL
ncbi:LPXTG cell wall anchor domain-containing protein [Bacillus cytotoxicus]|uniref:LPXTG cell wall anchor domain-containing protein n=1 Tax=Bacillus cereus group sp. BfR-BA-01492 TaxID=2920361 RepID=UPI001F5A0B36|nr:LPXTG cell wall anchor domain-containing protein [Bacillus cereus group sp. BfR-BA-01492]EMA6344134.1 LPXTG cell wall anchor domain-containing protein [Bacillus cytotoxicus]